MQDRVVSLLEQLRVVVLDVAVQLRDHRVLAVGVIGFQAGDEAAALELAHPDVVERDVVRSLASDHEAVVVDDLRVVADGVVGDRDARRRCELVEQDHLGALRDALLSLRELLLRVSMCIDDSGGHVRFPECGLQIRRVEQRVARRRCRIRQQRARLDSGGAPLLLGPVAGRGSCEQQRAEHENNKKRKRPLHNLLHELSLLR